jgi:hypothetical protein
MTLSLNTTEETNKTPHPAATSTLFVFSNFHLAAGKLDVRSPRNEYQPESIPHRKRRSSCFFSRRAFPTLLAHNWIIGYP